MLDVVNDYVIHCPTHRLTTLSAHTQLFDNFTSSRVWSYRWQYRPVSLPMALVAADLQQAAHGHELPFVFNQPNVLTNYTLTPQERGLSAILQNVIARFVLTGNPNQPLPDVDQRFATAYNERLTNFTDVRNYTLPSWPAFTIDPFADVQQLLIVQPDAAIAATTLLANGSSTGFSVEPATQYFGVRCDSVADAPLPLDNTAQLRLSVCANLATSADPCMHQREATNLCLDGFNNTYSCSCNAAYGYKPSPGALTCISFSVLTSSAPPLASTSVASSSGGTGGQTAALDSSSGTSNAARSAARSAAAVCTGALALVIASLILV